LSLIAHDQTLGAERKDAAKALTCVKLKGKKRNVGNALGLPHTWQLAICSTLAIKTTLRHCLLNLLYQSQFYVQLRQQHVVRQSDSSRHITVLLLRDC
jgi:hypothetical protein